MVTAPAIVHGPGARLLDFDPAEHPVAAAARRLRSRPNWPRRPASPRARGYDEVNLNVGCPSDRVQSGCFGAVLMETPDLVARLRRAR